MGYYVNRVREKVTNGQKNSMSLLIYHLLLLIPPPPPDSKTRSSLTCHLSVLMAEPDDRRRCKVRMSWLHRRELEPGVDERVEDPGFVFPARRHVVHGPTNLALSPSS